MFGLSSNQSENMMCAPRVSAYNVPHARPYTLRTILPPSLQLWGTTHVPSDICCCLAEDEAVLPLTVQFLKEQGRMKFLRPLYKALFKSKMGKETAVQTFKEARSSYHPIAAKMVAADLQVD